ncbi:MAG TPA: Rne/Rng family ribonuclease [Jatrophihabitantaceae bacterium]|nr:Rne/Rng family ribonuclease [Jatrophihabitantaceae bacterium]
MLDTENTTETPPRDSADDSVKPRKTAAKKAAKKTTAKKTPAKKAAATKRAAKKTPDPATEAGSTSAPALAAPAPKAAAPVLFVPPSDVTAPAATSKRARATKNAPPAAAAEPATTSAPPEPETSAAADAETDDGQRRRRRRGRRGRGGRPDEAAADAGAATTETVVEPEADEAETGEATEGVDGEAASRHRRRRRRKAGAADAPTGEDDPPNTIVHVREPRAAEPSDEVKGIRGSVRLEAKRQRRREGRESGRRRRAPILTEAEFLARRESVDRTMAVRQRGELTQIAVLEDGILVEHHVTRAAAASSAGNVYLGRVQNVLPGMEAAFVDIGRGRNGVLYAGEVNWDAAGLEGRARSIEAALKSGDTQLVQVTKDPIGHKGARLTSQISLPGRFLVYVPGGGMTGISRKLPDTERTRLKGILKKIVPEDAGVIVRTAAEGASEADLTNDVERLKAEWAAIEAKAAKGGSAPVLLHAEPDLAIRVLRDVFNEDFRSVVVDGDEAWRQIEQYVSDVAPDLADRVSKYTGTGELFHDLRVDEQLAKALERKVWLPSGGSLVIDRTEAMTVIDVNTGKFTGSGGNLESTVTKNNLEAAEEIVRQLRLRDVGGIVVIDFIDMVLESNRELVLRRLTECLGRDRTKHQVAEVTSLGLVQMTRKRVGEGLLEAFSEPCEVCHGRGVIVHTEPVLTKAAADDRENGRGRSKKGAKTKKKTAAEIAEEERLAAEAAEQRARAASAINLIASRTVAPAEPEPVPVSDETPEIPDLEPELVLDEAVKPAEAADALAASDDGVTLPASAPRPRRRRAARRPAGPPQPVLQDSAS